MARKKKKSADSKRSDAPPPDFDMAKDEFLREISRLGIPESIANDFWSVVNSPEGPQEIQDLMEELDAEIFDFERPPIPAGLTPRQLQAIQLAQEARLATTQHEFAKLVSDALDIWPNCPDIPLAMSECSAEDRDALAQAETAVGWARGNLRDDAANGTSPDPATNPVAYYLFAALARRAHLLWQANHCDAAIEDLFEVVAANHPLLPKVPEYLLNYLLIEKRDAEAARLAHEPFECGDTASWTYSQALAEFCVEDDAAARTIQVAYQRNPLIAEVLVGCRDIEQAAISDIDDDFLNEATDYCQLARRAWSDAPGAIRWLRDTLQLKPAEPTTPRTKPSFAREWKVLREQLLCLDLSLDESWEVGSFPLSLPNTSSSGAPEIISWSLVALQRESQQVLAAAPFEDKPNPSTSMRWLGSLMLRPDKGEPRRPSKILLNDEGVAKKLIPKLAEIGVKCEYLAESPGLELCAQIVERTARPTEWPQLDSVDEGALEELPRCDEVWQLEQSRLAVFIADQASPRRPWFTFVGDATNSGALSQDFSDDAPRAGLATQVLLAAMIRPSAGPARRPREVQVCQPTLRDELEIPFAKFGVRITLCDSLPFLVEFQRDLVRSLAGDDSQPGMLDSPGVTPEMVADVLRAAAHFYRSAPWRNVVGEVPIRLTSPSIQGGPWYAIVMGKAGMSKGLAIYDDLKFVRKLIRGDLSESQMRKGNAPLIVDFGEEFEFPVVDLYDQERFGWEIASPDAYPMIMQVNPGMSFRRPLAWELKLLEVALHAIPAYVARDRPGSHEYRIDTADGPVFLKLEWDH